MNAQLTNGHTLTADELRQYLGDADILPVVLGGPSGVLDVGQKRRLVTPTFGKRCMPVTRMCSRL
ncbi:MAG: hypothetical protein R2719_05605 [Micropruina sp.]